MHLYFANALFSHADFNYNAQLVAQIRQENPSLTIYLPQENAAINNKQAYADAKMIAQADTEEVLKSDLVIAILDGPTIDVGVASEIGVAYANHIPVLGLYTDSRQQGADNQQKLTALSEIAENQFHYLNLYTIGLIKLNGAVYNNEQALLAAISNRTK